MKSELRIPAIEVTQGSGRTLYTFAIDGKLVPRFATVSRVRRADDGTLRGYQRPEVIAHIEEIKTYIESDAPLIPNAVVLAFDSRVRFVPAGTSATAYARPGELIIPIDDALPETDRPGFVVDGQQRLAAIREAQVASFPICVSAFITDDLGVQTEQFILVNSAKPLPKGLLYELLPATHASLPAMLQRRKLPADLIARLNQQRESPLRGKILTATNPSGHIKDNSMLRLLEQSLTDGVLFRYYDRETGPNLEAMVAVLVNYFRAVSKVFKDAWDLPPKKSRLVHGAGVISMGLVMDAIADRHRARSIPEEDLFVKDLLPLQEVCRWTEGYWDFGPGQQRKWNEIQNTPKDIQLLSNYLLVQYKALVWSRRKNNAQLGLIRA